MMKRFWLPTLLLVGVGLLYLVTLDTGLRPEELTGGDLITHQYAQVEARPSNAPGYPLYTMLGWVWFKVGRLLSGGLLNPIQVLSLYSTIWGLLSLVTLYAILQRREVSGGRIWLATLLTLFYGVTYFFWYYSVTTEQYSSAIFQTLLLVWLAFKWEEKPTNSLLLAMALVSGTMAANMLTTLFILPPLLYLIFTRRPDIFRQPMLIAQATLAGLLPLLSYTFVYIRGAQHPEWRGAGEWRSTAEWFWQFVSTQQGRDELAPGLSLQNLITPEFPSLIWQELSLLVVIGGLVGLAMMGRRKTIFFFGTLLIYTFFVTAYRFGNWFQVVLPVYPLLVIGFGRLTAWLWQRTQTSSRRQTVGPALIVSVLILLVGWRLWSSYPRANQRHQPADTGLDPGRHILADATPGIAISATFEEWLALNYLQSVWRAQPAVQVVEPGETAAYLTVNAAEAFPTLLTPKTHPQASGATLIHLAPQASLAPPANLPALNARFGPALHLAACQTERNNQVVTLYWQSDEALSTDYTVSVRLLQNGQPLNAKTGPFIQDHQPVWNTYPTTRWQPGEVVADAYTFPDSTATQANTLHVVVYHPADAGFVNLGDQKIDLQWCQQVIN